MKLPDNVLSFTAVSRKAQTAASPLRAGESATWGPKPLARQVRITRFHEYRNPAGSLLGFFAVELPSGMVIHGLKLMVGPKGRRFVGMPDAKRRDRDDQPVLDEAGKPVWDPVVEFTDRAARDRFSTLVLGALRAQHPQLFDGEGAQ